MFEQFMQRYADELDATMRRVVDVVPDAPDLEVMVRYPMGWVDEHNRPYQATTGKRIRPLFLLLCNEAAGGKWHDALYAAAAVELLHNFSLIHDDIQDVSPTRHNRPTLWKIWGNANAINAGDILFSLAFVALHRLSETGLRSDTLITVWDVFNRTNLELTRGQHLDMQFEARENVSVDEYISMISGKSAALLATCAQIGALIAECNIQTAQYYADFALNLGIAFQIRDDILGIWGDPELTGKSVATDILYKKKSLPVLHGLAHSAELQAIYRRDSLTEADVQQAVYLLDEHDTRAYAENIERNYYTKALDMLTRANPRGEAAEWLGQFVETLFQRAY